jgi:hypothetical protein
VAGPRALGCRGPAPSAANYLSYLCMALRQKGEDKATRVCLERQCSRFKMVDLRGSSATRAQYTSKLNSRYALGVFRTYFYNHARRLRLEKTIIPRAF